LAKRESAAVIGGRNIANTVSEALTRQFFILESHQYRHSKFPRYASNSRYHSSLRGNAPQKKSAGVEWADRHTHREKSDHRGWRGQNL